MKSSGWPSKSSKHLRSMPFTTRTIVGQNLSTEVRVPKIFKYPRGASDIVDSAVDMFGDRVGPKAVERILSKHELGSEGMAEFYKRLGKAGAGAKWSTHKVFNVLGYSSADNPLLSRESANKAMNAASEVYETPAIKKARVKPTRRSI
jgi:hypothetical protein